MARFIWCDRLAPTVHPPMPPCIHLPPSPPAPIPTGPDCSVVVPGAPDGWTLLEDHMGGNNIPGCGGVVQTTLHPTPAEPSCIINAEIAYEVCKELGPTVCRYVCATTNLVWNQYYPNKVQLMGPGGVGTRPLGPAPADEWDSCEQPLGARR